MKSILLPCILFISPLGGYFAQNTLPLLDSTKTWSCYGDFFYLNVKYRLGDDTLLSGKLYKKVLAYSSDTPFTFDETNAEYKSALREEDGVVTVVEKGFTTEHILFNFNKQTGDTIRFYRPIGNFNQGVLPSYVIGKIYKTDVVTLNGLARKRWFIHDPYMINQLPPQALSGLDSQADIWIEGLGSKTGLFSRMPEWGVVGPQPYLLTCVDSNGSTVYSNNVGYNANNTDPCFIIPPEGSGGNGGGGNNDSLILTNNADMRRNESFVLFPNPAYNALTIRPISDPSTYLYIYDLAGNEVLFLKPTIYNNSIKIDINQLNSGAYFIHIQATSINKRFRFYKSNN